MPLLSVIIITKNEAHNIEDCLKSVAWADEIVVFDSGSTDNTVDICRRYTDKVFITDWPGYGAQKQRALEAATGEWVLSIDADERVMPQLKAEILSQIPHTSYDAFEITFSSEYCQKVIRFGDWWHDTQAVLFRRNQARFISLLAHERIEIQGKIGKLKGKIYHLAYPNLDLVLKKMNDYSSLSAKQKQTDGAKGSVLKAVFRGLWTFIRGYIFRLGFLDGKEGFLLAVSNAEGTYYKYVKLMYLNKGFQKNNSLF
jgi:glycosyltransferase involved in cell wall biosynthesis